MKTHILYSKKKRKKIYFCGFYTGDINKDGFVDVEWEWTDHKKEAILFLTTDAWDLLEMARKEWPQCSFEVERIITLNDLQTRFNRLPVVI